jgi:hypothetical protein
VVNRAVYGLNPLTSSVNEIFVGYGKEVIRFEFN